MSKIIKFKAPNPGHVARCGRTLGEIIHTYKTVATEAACVDEKTFVKAYLKYNSEVL